MINRALRVVHCSTFDIRGGAARATYDLHSSLRDMGIESQMLVGRKYGDDPDVVQAQSPLSGMLRGRLDLLPLKRYQHTYESFWTVGWQSSRVAQLVESLAPDIVHMHWTGGGFMPTAALAQIKRPVVWTMHDMWAFTGGCHYSGACVRYLEDCGRCPQLRSSSEEDISRRIRRHKQKVWKGVDLHLVGISGWLAGCARESGLFAGVPISVIPDGVNIERFRLPSREEARSGGETNRRQRILFGSINPQSDPRKGFPIFMEAMRDLAHRGWSERAEIVIFGCDAPETMPELGLPVRFTGAIDDDRVLAQLYADSDVMVVPSLQEAFGVTVIEAMACGTPVVAFAAGGPGEIIIHQQNGYLAEPYSPTSLANGIEWCMTDPVRLLKLGTAASLHAREIYALPVVARQYMELYEEILTRVGVRERVGVAEPQPAPTTPGEHETRPTFAGLGRLPVPKGG